MSTSLRHRNSPINPVPTIEASALTNVVFIQAADPKSSRTGHDAFQTTPLAVANGVNLLLLSQMITEPLPDTAMTVAACGCAVSIPLLMLSWFVNKSRWNWPMRDVPLTLGYLGMVVGIAACVFHVSLGAGIAFVIMTVAVLTTVAVLEHRVSGYQEPSTPAVRALS